MPHSYRYQSRTLLNTPWGHKNPANAHLLVELDIPTAVASNEEYEVFQRSASPTGSNGENIEIAITPPIFCKMQQKGLVKMVPHEIEYLSMCKDKRNADYDSNKPRENYVRVGTNPNFVTLEDSDDYLSHGYHTLGPNGDGYRVFKKQVYFPVNYYSQADGCMISCKREMMSNKGLVKSYIDNGTGDIIGHRSVKKSSGAYKHSWMVRTYKVLECPTHVLDGKASLHTCKLPCNLRNHQTAESCVYDFDDIHMPSSRRAFCPARWRTACSCCLAD
jgi:hypothetical protein